MGHSFIFLPLRMIRVLAFLCLIALALGDAVPDAQPNADADADPYLLYGGHLGYYGLGYRGLYGYYGRKRRSADAEPVPDAQPAAAADADPYLLYGGHLGYYPLGYYGLGYRGLYGYYGRKRRSADADAA